MVESVYKVVEIIGTSDKSWEDAAKVAVNTASKSLRDLRVAEVKELDMKVEEGNLIFRVKMNLSFKYQD
ncbi:MAG: dodecin family protein [Bacillota bacterium]